jgi:hypothetical protein
MGSSEHTNQESDLLRRERASVVVGTGVAFCGERERVVSEGEDIDEQ